MVTNKNNPRSLRSLTSLQLVPLPEKSRSNSDDIAEDIENWDPFPAPYAPHAMNEQRTETRDERECRLSASDKHCARDGAVESLQNDDSIGNRKTPLSTVKIPVTPPRVFTQPRRSEAAAAYEQRKKYLRRLGSSSRSSRSRTPEKNQAHEALIKIPASDSGARNESQEKIRQSLSRMRDAPILTKGRVKQHQRAQSQHDSPHNNVINQHQDGGGTKRIATSGDTPAKSVGQGREKDIISFPQPSSDSARKIFMIGTSKAYSRTLIPPTVYHNTATDLWVVIINTNAKLVKPNCSSQNNINNNSVKAFSFHTEKEARASAYANAPPIMIPFDQCQGCMLCDTKFTMFKRPRHCRNCGICICSNYSCSTIWSKKMIPETFNTKKEGAIKVCTSCHALAERFQHALVNGRYGTAVELYLTGNINLRVPFAFKGNSNEIMFPIHCAIKGESEKLLRWLVDVQHCPIHAIHTRNSKGSSVTSSVIGAGADMIKSFGSSTEQKYDFLPTLKTSKGRSVLDIAMKVKHVGILCYLINEKNVNVYEVEELELALGSMEAVVKAFQERGSYDPCMFSDKEHATKCFERSGSSSNMKEGESKNDGDHRRSFTVERVVGKSNARRRRNDDDKAPKNTIRLSHSVVTPPKGKILIPRDVHGIRKGHGLYDAIGGYDGKNNDSDNENGEEEHNTIVLDDDGSVSTTVPDMCILCRENDVDCVATPCGHQMCCLACSNQCLKCPICNLECHFIEIYQP